MVYDLTISVHKGTCSSAHLGHNRRTISVPHADKSRQHLNKCYIDMELSEAYRILFDNALKEYNADKKPSRQIKDYLAHITEQYEKGEQKLQEAKSRGASRKELAKIKSRYPKPFFELIVSVGSCDTYGGIFASGGEKEEIVVDILNEYVKDFHERNPYLFVFSAHLHRDEKGVPHIHMDYIPWTDEQGRGLSIRVSENGAFKQQGLTTGQTGDIGSIAFQNQERAVLMEIARRHDINIIEGKHSKKHLSKEEYILRQEQDKSAKDHQLIEEQAGELLSYQDELLDYIKTNKLEDSFSEHLENISLKQDRESYKKIKQRNKKVLASCWNDYKTYTSSFFAEYKANKAVLWNELQWARKNSYANKKRLHDLINDITVGTDLLIIKIIKLFIALFMAIDNVLYDNEIERLQEANRQLKQQAKEVMRESSSMATTLRTQDIENIEHSLEVYEESLINAKNLINNTILQLNKKKTQDYER